MRANGVDPVSERYRERMTEIARLLDMEFNGAAVGEARKVGFTLIVFPFGNAPDRRANYISNAQRDEMVRFLRELVGRFDALPPSSSNDQ